MAIKKEEVLKHLKEAGVNSLDDLAKKIEEKAAETVEFSAMNMDQAAPDITIQGSWCFFHFPS